jgi:hypothetical protein
MNSFDQLIKPSSSCFFILTKSGDSFSLFDSKNTSAIRTFSQDRHPIEQIIFSAGQNTLLCLPSHKSLLCLYSVNSNAAYLKCGTVEKFTCGFVSKSEDFSVFGSVHGNVFLFNSVSGTMLGSFRVSNKAVKFADVSECGCFALFACFDNHVYVYRIQEVINLFVSKGNNKGRKGMLREMVKEQLQAMVTCAKWKDAEDLGHDIDAEKSPKDFLYGRICLFLPNLCIILI